MKHNKNVDTRLFLLSFTTFIVKKNIERTFFVSAGTLNVWETAGAGSNLPQYLPNPKNKFQVKFIFT